MTGATPDKWAGVWRERYPREPLELVPVTEAEQESLLRDGSVDMALVRLPVDREGLHVIPLYDEVPVVVAGHEHLVAAADEVDPGRPRRRAAGAPPPLRAGVPTRPSSTGPR